jgi:metallo-beta-lactamase family protein
MKLTFFGATRQVTGSMYLLELDDDYRILIDCGFDLQNGRRFDPSPEGIFPFDPTTINVVLLTHAHVDHSGNIPNLFKAGFEGQVICTLPTYYLSALLLRDSANLNQKRLNTTGKNRRGKKFRVAELIEKTQLYFEGHVTEALDKFFPIAYQKRFKLRPGVHITLNQAGHLLGAANIIVEAETAGETKKICFSGDVGRKNYPMLPDPVPIPPVDYLICESTYGGRLHKEAGSAGEVLLDVIDRACIKKIGKLLIPAFSVGRTQALLYELHKLSIAGKLPKIPIYVDSPMALESIQIYQEMVRYTNAEARELSSSEEDLFSFDQLEYVKRISDSKALSNHFESAIIISASGMLEGGRIQTHLKTQLQNPNATVLFIGYVADGTLGRTLIDGAKAVTVDGKRVEVNAKLEANDIFSGHADEAGLLDFVGGQKPTELRKIFLVHGELESMHAFKSKLEEKGYAVEMPLKGQRFEL